MGQNTSKRRSYTPGQDPNSELPESTVTSPAVKVNGDAKVNGSIEVHEEELDVTTPTSPTSVTSAASASSTGKKEKKRKLRFIGFSLKRTPSGRWSRKRRANAPNGTARPVSCPDPIREQENLNSPTGRPQSFILEELDITEDGPNIETVDLSDHDEEPKSKSDDKKAPKAPERNKGKRGSQKKGSGKKKKEKKSSKKDKKKGKKQAPEPAVAVATAAVTETAKSAGAAVQEAVKTELKDAVNVETSVSAEEVMKSTTLTSVSVSPEPSTSQGHTDQAKPASPSSDEPGLEAVASTIVQESVAIAQKRLLDESVPNEGNTDDGLPAEEIVQSQSSVVSGDASLEVSVEDIPPPQPFADSQEADVSLVDEVINAINAEPIEAIFTTNENEADEPKTELGITQEVTPVTVEASAVNDGIEVPDRPIVANIVSGLEQDIVASTVAPSFVAKVDVSENSEFPATAVSDLEDVSENVADKVEVDTSISEEAAEAVAVAEQAEAELKAIVASSSSEPAATVEVPTHQISGEVSNEASGNASAHEDTSIVQEIREQAESVKEKITEAAVDVPEEAQLAISAAVSGEGKQIVEKTVSDSDSEKARHAEQEKEKKEKERLEREKLKKQREEEKAKEKERVKQEKKKKAEQKAAEKAEKEKSKEKKSIVPKRLSQFFSKKEKPRVVAEFEVKAPEAEASAETKHESVESKSSPPQSPIEVGEPQEIAALEMAVEKVEEPASSPPNEEAANPSLSIDVSVEPLIKSAVGVENESSPSSPNSDSINQSASESVPGSPTSDTHDPGSDGGSGEGSSGGLKKISIGPRLRTAILRKKSSGASDSGHNVSLTTPKVVENADLTPPPRKLGPRRPKEQYSPITPGAHNPAANKDADSALRPKSEEAKAEEATLFEAKHESDKDNVSKLEDALDTAKTEFGVAIPGGIAKIAEEAGDSLLGSVSSSVVVDSQEQIKSIPPSPSSQENEITSETAVGSNSEQESSQKDTSFSANIDVMQLVTDNKDVIVDKVSDLLKSETPDKYAVSSDVIDTEQEESSEKPSVVEEVMSAVTQVSAHCAPRVEKSQSTPTEVQSSVVVKSPNETELPQLEDTISNDAEAVSETTVPDTKEVRAVVENIVQAAVKQVESSPLPVVQTEDHQMKLNSEVNLPWAQSESIERSVTVDEQISSSVNETPAENDDGEEEDEEDEPIAPSPTLVSTASIVLRPSLSDDVAAVKDIVEEVAEISGKSENEDSSAFEEPQASAPVEEDDSTSNTKYTVKCAAQTVVDTVVSPVVDVSEVVQDEQEPKEAPEESTSMSDTVSQLVSQASKVMVGTSGTFASDPEESSMDVTKSDADEKVAEKESSIVDKVVEKAESVVSSVKDTFSEPKSTTIAEYHIGVSHEGDDTDATGAADATGDDTDSTLTQTSSDPTFDSKMDKHADDLEKTLTAEGDENANEISSALKNEVEIKTNGCVNVDIDAPHPHLNGVGNHEVVQNADVSVSLNDSAIEKDLDESDVKEAVAVVVNGVPDGDSDEDKTGGPTADTIEAYLKLQTSEGSVEKLDKTGEKNCVPNGCEESSKQESLLRDHFAAGLDNAKLTG